MLIHDIAQGTRSLLQLPDIGANTAQATGTIRRDLWQPLFSVSFPPAPSPANPNENVQGLHAYRRLREWRRLHELYWKPPASLSQPYTEQQKEALQKRLDERGGSKKETIYNLIKREKKKVRRREVMDQKANSVADLAAVLIEQQEEGAVKGDHSYIQRRQRRLDEVEEIRELSMAASKDGFQKLDAEIEALKPYAERRLGYRKEDGAKLSQIRARRQIYDVEAKKARMQAAVDAVAAYREELQKTQEPERPAKLSMQVEDLIPKNDLDQQKAFAAAQQQVLDGSLAKRISKQEERVQKAKLAQEQAVEHLQRMEQQQEEALKMQPDPVPAPDFGQETEQSDAALAEPTEVQAQAQKERQHARAPIQREYMLALKYAQKRVEQAQARAQGRLDTAKTRVEQAPARIAEAQAELDRLTTLHNEALARNSALFDDANRSETETPLYPLLPSLPPAPPLPADLFPPNALRAHIRAQNRQQTPSFSMQGVRIKWSDPLDAEYAQAWPQAVEHAPMGFARPSGMPSPTAPPIYDAAERRERAYSYLARKGEARNRVVRERAEAVLSAVDGVARQGKMEKRRVKEEAVAVAE